VIQSCCVVGSDSFGNVKGDKPLGQLNGWPSSLIPPGATMAAKKTKAEQLEALRQQEAALKARMQALQASVNEEQRKLDTRRKIVFGGALMTHASHNTQFAALVRSALNVALTKEADRELLKDWLTVAKESTTDHQLPVTAISEQP